MKILITSKWYLTVKDDTEAERAVHAVIANNEDMEGSDAELGVKSDTTWKPTREHKKRAEIAAANTAN